MKIIETIKAFFRAPTGNPVVLTAISCAQAALERFSGEFDSIIDYSSRVDHCYESLHYWNPRGADTDSDDFEPYTEAELDAHTAAIESFTAAFDVLTAAFDTARASFATIDVADRAYAELPPLYDSHYEVCCNAYRTAVEAYRRAAHCALVAAHRDQLQLISDEGDAFILGLRAKTAAENGNETDAAAWKAKAIADEAKVAEEKTKNEALQEKAKQAEVKSKALLAIADFTEAIRFDPSYSLAYYSRGDAYAETGDYARAIADFTEAIRLDPSDSLA